MNPLDIFPPELWDLILSNLTHFHHVSLSCRLFRDLIIDKLFSYLEIDDRMNLDVFPKQYLQYVKYVDLYTDCYTEESFVKEVKELFSDAEVCVMVDQLEPDDYQDDFQLYCNQPEEYPDSFFERGISSQYWDIY